MQRRPTNAYHPRRVRGVIVVHRARSVSGFRYRYTRAYDIRSAGQMHRTIMRSLAYLRVTDVPELGLYRKHTIEKAPLAYPIRKTTSRIPKAGGLMNRTPAEGSTCLRCPLSRWGTCSPPPPPPNLRLFSHMPTTWGRVRPDARPVLPMLHNANNNLSAGARTNPKNHPPSRTPTNRRIPPVAIPFIVPSRKGRAAASTDSSRCCR